MQKQFAELTDSQWQVIEKFLDVERKRKNCLRTIINAILWITRTGAQWRNLESKYPPWSSVYYYFRTWQKTGVWGEILKHLVQLERESQGRNAEPSAVAIDSQSVKKVSFISISTGIDGGKRVNGRKRHLAVDVLGLPVGIYVGPANNHDSVEGVELLWQIENASRRVRLISADKAYRGDFEELVTGIYNWGMDISQKPESQSGFVPQKKRWQVERSFAWLNFYRRLTRDYERLPESSVLFIQLAFCSIILARRSG
ncbi:IS5 family transposase [Pontibacter sp. G13]|uniref:IS5 family transposase n=1 Tax=Pontibacter sp. G13 TaxID=3074898 RepID=UPI00288BAA63|nr:IS5 family transposase [Pontibacter sp. G13]WNJ19509.1 IS5 family transposase [Pontibacter sp. G13]